MEWPPIVLIISGSFGQIKYEPGQISWMEGGERKFFFLSLVL